MEERRSPKVISHLPEERSLVQLVFAVLIRVSDKENKKSFSAFEQRQIRSLQERLKLNEYEVTVGESQSEMHSRRSAASAA